MERHMQERYAHCRDCRKQWEEALNTDPNALGDVLSTKNVKESCKISNPYSLLQSHVGYQTMNNAAKKTRKQ